MSWFDVDREGLAKIAARKGKAFITPSPRPFQPDGEALLLIPPEDWTSAMGDLASFAREIAKAADMPCPVVHFTRDRDWGFGGAYSRETCDLTINLANRVHDWPARGHREAHLRLIIHELAHQFGHHLEEGYHDAICRIGAAAAMLALRCPSLFRSGS